MPASGRRPIVIAAACVGFGLLLYQFLPRDESRIAALLDEVCTRLNQTRDDASLTRLRQFLPGVLRPQVNVHAAELEQDLDGVDAVLRRAAELLGGAPLTFAFSSVKIHLSDRLARVDADLLVTVRGSGEQRRDLRRTRVRLAKVSDVWQIEAIEVDAVVPSEPEARP